MSAMTEAMKELPDIIARATHTGEAGLKLRQCVVEIRHRQGRSIEDLLAIGAELTKARDILRGAYEKGAVEGEWLSWLRDDLRMSHMQAANFIRVWERYGKGGLNPGLTPVPFSVLRELAAPDADPETVAQIEEHIAQGGTVTKRQVIAAKRKAKARKPSGMRSKSKGRGMNVLMRELHSLMRRIRDEHGDEGVNKAVDLILKKYPAR